MPALDSLPFESEEKGDVHPGGMSACGGGGDWKGAILLATGGGFATWRICDGARIDLRRQLVASRRAKTKASAIPSSGTQSGICLAPGIGKHRCFLARWQGHRRKAGLSGCFSAIVERAVSSKVTREGLRREPA
jgi:hypothetical protein